MKYGVGLIGPGDAGPWTAERDDDEFEGGFVRRFASEVQVGDIFLLRTGISRICAVGIVASDYRYLSQFDDVNGWDLQHARRVRWQPLPEAHDFGAPVFGANPSRLSRVQNSEVVDYAVRFLNSPPTHWQTAALPELPSEEPPLENVPSALQGLVAAANDLVPLLWDRQAFGEHPSEDELIAHFVVPFLRALGWPPERIAVKWRCIDVAVFKALPRTPENCHLVIEAKRLGAGVEGALEQAKGYVEALGAPRDVVVTDGIRYRMYSCQSGFQPIAYANLGRMKKSAAELFARMKRP
ncbi:MAG: hypothetical protein ACP5RC_05030 [Halothiobacillaceae bacterium]